MPRKEPKVFKKGDFIIGYTTSFRMGNILEFSFDPPLAGKNGYNREYMNTCFIDAIRDSFLVGGFSQMIDMRESGGEFLVGVEDRLYEVSDDFQIGEYINSYIAVGSGDNHAMGALSAIDIIEKDLPKKYHRTIEEKITIGLESASQFSGWVSEPFDIINT
jgi:hypothetical protein